MNIFILDKDFSKCVEYYFDCHVVKMITEHMQMLFDAHHFVDPENYLYWDLCKPFSNKDGKINYRHRNHPCTKWVRESLSNWKFVKELSKALNYEWRYRYNHPKTKNHRSWEKIKNLPEPELPDVGCTPMINSIEEYRFLYNSKQHLSVVTKRKNKKIISKRPAWLKRNIPYWYNFDFSLLNI